VLSNLAKVRIPIPSHCTNPCHAPGRLLIWSIPAVPLVRWALLFFFFVLCYS
jgi:hypothetical protein